MDYDGGEAEDYADEDEVNAMIAMLKTHKVGIEAEKHNFPNGINYDWNTITYKCSDFLWESVKTFLKSLSEEEDHIIIP